MMQRRGAPHDDDDPYAVFDAVVVITLAGADARQRHIRAVLAALGVRSATFHVAAPDPHGGRHGCFASHVAVCREAYAAGCTNVLVFEDDAVPSPGYTAAVMRDVRDFVRRPDADWDRVQLGYSFANGLADGVPGWLRLMRSPEVHPHIVRHHGPLTHAMCLSRRAMRRVVRRAPAALARGADVGHYDDWLSRTLSARRQYSVVPMVFDQRWSFESQNVPVSWTEAHVVRGHPALAERWPVFYYASVCRHRRPAVVLGALAALAAVAALAVWWAVRRARRPGSPPPPSG